MSNLNADVDKFCELFNKVRTQIAKSIVGLEDVVFLNLVAIFSAGHVLLEGAPGLGKTSLVKAIAQSLNISYRRVQFTADLMPADITGTQILAESSSGQRDFSFKPGPLFANIVLADEINRAGPKTQSALLEAMEEKQVTVFGQTYALPQPYFVLATQNPIELEGTYPLPEAQLDRFMFKIKVDLPSQSELTDILIRTTGSTQGSSASQSESSLTDAVSYFQNIAREVVISKPSLEALVSLVYSLMPDSNTATDMCKQNVRYGPGPRGAQSILLASKVVALSEGRMNVSFKDIKRVIVPALRHRLIMNYKAEAEGIDPDQVILNALGN